MKTLILCFWLCLPIHTAYAGIDPLLEAEDLRTVNAPIWQTALSSPSIQRRTRLALALGRLQSPKAIPMLLRLLKDKASKVREMALFSLGQLGWSPRFHGRFKDRVVQALKRQQQDPDLEVRRAAIEAIGKYAPRGTVAWLHPLLKKSPAPLQAEALLALFRTRLHQKRHAARKKQPLPALPGLLLQTLRALAGHPKALVRRNVAYYFARLPDKQGLGILLKLTKDKAQWVRYFALFALRKIKSPKALEPALKASLHANPILSVAGIQLIDTLKLGHRLSPQLVRSPSHHVRAALATAYGNSPSQPLSALLAMEKDPSPTVQAAVVLAAARRLKQKSAPLLLRALQSSSWVVRVAAIHASKALPKQQLVLLQRGMKDNDVRVRAATIEQLGRQHTPQAWSLIRKALRSPQLSERGSAVELLSRRKEADALEEAWRCYLRSLSSRWIEARESLVAFFAGRKGTRAKLLAILKDPSPFIAHKASLALKKRGLKALPKHARPPKKWKRSPFHHWRFSKNPRVALRTNKGIIVLECDAKTALRHTANFVGFVQRGLYDGLPWHRVISNFVIQGGDPDRTGWGSAGFHMRAEINRHRFGRGVLGMPRSQGWDTGGVQIFITHTPTPHLDGLYTVFGKVLKGFDVLDRIEQGDLILKAIFLNPSVRRQPTSIPTSRKTK